MIKKNNESSDDKYSMTHIKKSLISDSKKDIFKNELNLKYIEKNKYMNFCIYIKGKLEPQNFLNILGKQIKEKFSNCLIKTDEENKPNFNVTFTGEGIFENIKEQLTKLGIKKEDEDEDNEEDDINELILRIKFYKTSEGYLLRFIKRQGDKVDFINKYETIKKLVEEIIV